jgi:hypothetical protein
VVNIARSQKVERETNDAGMTVRNLLPRIGPQKSLLRPRCGLHPLDEGTATGHAAHRDEGSNRLSQGIRCHRDQRFDGVGHGAWTRIDGFSESILGFIQEVER